MSCHVRKAHLVADLHQAVRFAVGIEQFDVRPANDLPPRGGVEGVDPRLPLSDADGPRRDPRPRRLQPRRLDPFIQDPQIRESGRKADGKDGIKRCAVDRDDFTLGKARMRGDKGQVRTVIAAVAGRNLVDSRRGRLHRMQVFEPRFEESDVLGVARRVKEGAGMMQRHVCPTGAFYLAPDTEGTYGSAAMASVASGSVEAFGYLRYLKELPPPMLPSPDRVHVGGLTGRAFLAQQEPLPPTVLQSLMPFLRSAGCRSHAVFPQAMATETVAPFTTVTVYHFVVWDECVVNGQGEPAARQHLLAVIGSIERLAVALTILESFGGDRSHGVLVRDKQLELFAAELLPDGYQVVDIVKS